MALIYVTGAPGAGKSTLENELKSRGFETHDIDDPDLGGAHNKHTGLREDIPPAEQRTAEWFANHEWKIFKPAIERLKQRAQKETIFLCGVTPDDTELLPLVDNIIYLDVSEETIKERLANRTDNDYGKNDFELNDILERRRAMEATYKSMGVVSIDGSREPQAIADAIISQVIHK